jgi:hypothetical protein
VVDLISLVSGRPAGPWETSKGGATEFATRSTSVERLAMTLGRCSSGPGTTEASRRVGSAPSGNDLLVANARGFAASTWVELSDDLHDLSAVPGAPVKLAQIDDDRLTVDPASVDNPSHLVSRTQLSNPKVRQSDQHANDATVLVRGAVPITEGTEQKDWIEWPHRPDEFVAPLGSEHHYAPLGFVLPGENHIQDCRRCEGSREPLRWPNRVK